MLAEHTPPPRSFPPPAGPTLPRRRRAFALSAGGRGASIGLLKTPLSVTPNLRARPLGLYLFCLFFPYFPFGSCVGLGLIEPRLGTVFCLDASFAWLIKGCCHVVMVSELMAAVSRAGHCTGYCSFWQDEGIILSLPALCACDPTPNTSRYAYNCAT